jgi:hypothetical protein
MTDSGGSMTTLAQDAQKYAVLVAKRKDLETEVDTLKETLTKLEESLLTRMGDEGVVSLKVDTAGGRFTLFPKRQLWSSCIPGHEQELHDGLRALDLGDLVKESVNSQRLSSYVRELDVTGTAIPPEVAGAIKVTERFTIGVRKA